MISLRKHIESHADILLKNLLGSYQQALRSFGRAADSAIPNLDHDLARPIQELGQQLDASLSGGLIESSNDRLDGELSKWVGRVSQHLKNRAAEVREIVLIVANAAESVSERDKRYVSRFNALTTRLRAIADLEDLARIRPLLLLNAAEVQTEVMRMEEEGKETVSKLQAEVDSYKGRLAAAERRETLDSLTGFKNRGGVEKAIEVRREERRTFCILVLDLNSFKEINDTHGHVAGDELLRQFAEELRVHFRVTDVLGRWGGDEFVIVLDCALPDAANNIEQIRKWAFGNYKVNTGKGVVQVRLSAALGIAQWDGKEDTPHLLARADESMYGDKRAWVSVGG